MQDRPALLSPSGPGLVCVVLNETRVDDTLADALTDALLHGGKRFTRCAWWGRTSAPGGASAGQQGMRFPWPFCRGWSRPRNG